MTETTSRVAAGPAHLAHDMTHGKGHGMAHGNGHGGTGHGELHKTADRDLSAPATRARKVGRFLAHLAEMVVVMVLGMMLLAPAWDWAGAALGIEAVLGRPDVGAVVMVLDMVAAMTVWMRVRRHGWPAIWEMNAAMAAPFAVLLVLFWAGVVGAGDLMLWGHVLMVPAMAGAMLLRPSEYIGHVHSGHVHSGHVHGGLDLAWLGRRWPVLLALVLLAGTIVSGVGDLPVWLILAVALVYPVVGLVRRSIRGRSMVLLQAAGLAVFAGIALLAIVFAGQDTGAYVVAAGLLGHGIWDAFHHRANAVVWRWWAEACVVYDVLLAAAVVAVTIAS